MAIPEDEAAASGAGSDQPQNPIPNGNPNQNPNANPYPNPNSNQNPNPNSPHTTKGSIGKSCKGCAYYSSVYKTKSKNPTCVGFSRTLQQVPPFLVGETELEAMKEGRSLANFKYACIGYSVYLDDKDSSADSQDKKAKLPFCLGLEVVLEEKPNPAVGHVSATHKTEDEHGTPKPGRYTPPNRTTEFFNRFQRNAGLVVSGVAKDLNRAGNYVKDLLNDILN
ncbi:hypothetical protein VIGAN_06228400 [Vigna angularis var. angularis]|uniref:DUF8204 domain-containing protein n=1 Tax=Vigna angularis var. angularis TaxID=157739 RepID=A0A0S3SDR8_PHAAN|nr:uncharacterized protein LOC108339561 [Vigna angularis]BAT90984.1 hypothetical protein VIGAN_06228400 [Vigna angularis var. angularis]